MANVDFDPYKRYGDMFQQITDYTDRLSRRVLIEPENIRPFGKRVKVIPGKGAGERSLVLAPVDGALQMSADEGIAEIGDTRLTATGPFQEVVFTPTIQRGRRTRRVTIRHLGDLFVG
ncbi:hypothetical protein A2875_05445 [Candidatus Gottesmanbacteria bacterium RIFCSPHIGHO2_01_FULL_46_14]|uniref:Uncharacterized protein n=2 Tax=Candidatus Gottesmaniibacteriota TaxID=1752720 RepID=A0A1F5ZJF4_9BACT|nr:MAG: hypothetical protein A2875_05445 [Candidatus Gottesmanbacteria bacterium RIFCSPHIGHO2_01_FULL_46_14]OGG28594.1 MAG: hypothetical protein A2971_01740 [Candidatus Gottesmanbacteria bacterium RIFCSPLOWO2_01_FULL_46_21]